MNQRENIDTQIFSDAQAASVAVAQQIKKIIELKASKYEMAVLGLATGSTPKALYAELVRLHKEEGLSFENVITFNLDEYFPMAPKELQSYYRFMHEHLFDLVDIKKKNINIPKGMLAKENVQKFCRAYEDKIDACGGLDIQILGIGRTGHIGFNEPGSGLSSLTRLITLDHITLVDASSDFFGEENVPKKAITMGIGTIMKARKIILMAWGEGKAGIIKQTVEGPITDTVPATYLQKHSNTEIVLDEASSAELTRVKTPWLVGQVDWNKELIKKAVIWLSLKLDKPVLKLTNRDYGDHGMVDIVTEYESAYNINIEIFNILQHTITGWPGGKPNAPDEHRPERAKPAKKRAIIFSPHPDDDVISMGGTFARLHEQGHEVHVVYQTSGNIAVFDDEAVRYADFIQDYHDAFKTGKGNTKTFFKKIKRLLAKKKPYQVDPEEVQIIKGLIRKAEAKSGARYIGIPESNMHFLDMPFYQTGLVKKKPLGPEDINITVDLIKKIKPHQIFAAGDLSDPHGTHRVCLDAIFRALAKCKKYSWCKDTYLWLYRGAWQEWDIHDIDMAVPMSPEQLLRKRRAIFKHQSQKDRPLFPGNDSREFWQRAEQRNLETARLYDKLGLAEYEAMEAFKRFKF